MFRPVLSPNGNHCSSNGIKHGVKKVYPWQCDQCGLITNRCKSTDMRERKCKCENRKPPTLTIDGQTRTLKKWCDTFEGTSYISCRVRHSRRKQGLRDCTDAEVLFGYGKTEKSYTSKFLLKPLEERSFDELFEYYLMQHIGLPLAQAAKKAYEKASGILTKEDKKPLLTQVGLEFMYSEISMEEFLKDCGCARIAIEELRFDNFTDEVIQSLFNRDINELLLEDIE